MSFDKKTQYRWNSCARKIPYRRKIRACRAIERMKKSGINVRGLVVYECRICGYFHVGHNRKSNLTE